MSLEIRDPNLTRHLDTKRRYFDVRILIIDPEGNLGDKNRFDTRV